MNNPMNNGALHRLPYTEQLKHPLWQKRRLEVLEAAGWACVCCGARDSQLHAHHKAYVKGRLPWDYADSMLECLCDRCHEAAHAQKNRINLHLAQHPSSELPVIARLVARLGECWKADPGSQRADAINRLNDELDAVQDFQRGPGGAG